MLVAHKLTAGYGAAPVLEEVELNVQPGEFLLIALHNGRILLRELGEYRPELLERPRLTVGTKSDSAVHDWDGATLSSITNQGVRELVGRMATLVHQARAVEPDSEGLVIIRPQADGARVERVGEREFRLVGRQVERVVALNDVTTPEALSYIDHQLSRLGVKKMLARAGARDGDVVWIAGFSFEYHEEP